MNKQELNQILDEILEIDRANEFLQYIVKRIQRDDYRGWHVSQHNRYDLDDINLILEKIHIIADTGYFVIPPGDYPDSSRLDGDYEAYQKIVDEINTGMGRGTLNSIKKNFFPDLEKMGFLQRLDIDNQPNGKLTESAVNLLKADMLIDRYKIFTDGVDKLFGDRLSELAEMLHLSDYSGDLISINEFMLIFTDENSIDKIGLLDSFRCLARHKSESAIELLKKYASPDNFDGDKSQKRDYHNWKNQSQQILNLLKTTVYFTVEPNHGFSLNIGNTGFFQQRGARSSIPKREYFEIHDVSKRDQFELHHVVPIAVARNREEAKLIDDHRNLLYLHKDKHREIKRKQVALDIDRQKAKFSSLDANGSVVAWNGKDASHSEKCNVIKNISDYNAKILSAIFNYQ